MRKHQHWRGFQAKMPLEAAPVLVFGRRVRLRWSAGGIAARVMGAFSRGHPNFALTDCARK